MHVEIYSPNAQRVGSARSGGAFRRPVNVYVIVWTGDAGDDVRAWLSGLDNLRARRLDKHRADELQAFSRDLVEVLTSDERVRDNDGVGTSLADLVARRDDLESLCVCAQHDAERVSKRFGLLLEVAHQMRHVLYQGDQIASNRAGWTLQMHRACEVEAIDFGWLSYAAGFHERARNELPWWLDVVREAARDLARVREWSRQKARWHASLTGKALAKVEETFDLATWLESEKLCRYMTETELNTASTAYEQAHG